MILFSGAKVQKNFEQCKYFKKKDFEKLFFLQKSTLSGLKQVTIHFFGTTFGTRKLFSKK